MARMKNLVAAAAAVAVIGTAFGGFAQSAQHSHDHAAAAQTSPQAMGASPQGLAGQPGMAGGGMNMMPMMQMMNEMGRGGGMGGMGGGQPGAPMGGMSGGMESMCCMGAMGKAPGAGTPMAMPSALPGFPGASHLYHVGATGFFLDYGDKLGLTVQQTTALNGIKQRALGEQSAAQRKSDEAEQALWMLTAAEEPDGAAIAAKLREIEKLKSDERLAIISAVGEAAKVLNADQRRMVLGMVPMPGTAPPKL